MDQQARSKPTKLTSSNSQGDSWQASAVVLSVFALLFSLITVTGFFAEVSYL
jgi:hypothetical protein